MDNKDIQLKTEKELIQDRINELEYNIHIGRRSGKTYRAINRIIDELFNKPIGTKIALVDAVPFDGEQSLHLFAKQFSDRMRRDFPETHFKITYPQPGLAVAVRLSETYQETAKKRLAQWKNKLNEL